MDDRTQSGEPGRRDDSIPSEDAGPEEDRPRVALEFAVGEHDTATALGSGDLPVLGTPRLLAWCEAATCAAAAVARDQSSVGTAVALEHLAASPVGDRLSVEATLRDVDGRRLGFDVVARRLADGTVVGRGEVHRVVVDRERFLARLSRPGG
jgi:predicted thioesterase